MNDEKRKHIIDVLKSSGGMLDDATCGIIADRVISGNIPPLNKTLGRLESALDAAETIQCLAREIEKLAHFKSYVHDRLDKMGIPTNPDGPHSKEGCRVGERLDIVERRIAALLEAMKRIRDARDAIAEGDAPFWLEDKEFDDWAADLASAAIARAEGRAS